MDFSATEKKKLKVPLQFSKTACPLESLERNMDKDYVDAHRKIG